MMDDNMLLAWLYGEMETIIHMVGEETGTEEEKHER